MVAKTVRSCSGINGSMTILSLFHTFECFLTEIIKTNDIHAEDMVTVDCTAKGSACVSAGLQIKYY